VPYPSGTRQRVLAVSDTTCTTAQISRLNFELGRLYADAVAAVCRNSGVPLATLALAGCHGQTIYHEGGGPTPNTLQIGEADVIAEQLGIPVVSGFRTRDMAAGGQGAPLVPFADYLLFGHRVTGRVALNIGGIANITLLPGGAGPETTVAFDTGPGNMVIDQLVEHQSGGARHFDEGGKIAEAGRVDDALLRRLLANPYYDRQPPKSAGREQFGREFVRSLLASGSRIEDLVATATALTAETIARAIREYAPWVREVAAAGGGVHNGFLMERIGALLPGVDVVPTSAFGVDPDAREAIAFAVLAHRTWHRQTGNLPSATGAGRAVILGKISF